MDEDEKYNRKLESGLYTLQVSLFYRLTVSKNTKSFNFFKTCLEFVLYT